MAFPISARTTQRNAKMAMTIWMAAGMKTMNQDHATKPNNFATTKIRVRINKKLMCPPIEAGRPISLDDACSANFTQWELNDCYPRFPAILSGVLPLDDPSYGQTNKEGVGIEPTFPEGQGLELNQRPSGYEPAKLPLLYPALICASVGKLPLNPIPNYGTTLAQKFYRLSR